MMKAVTVVTVLCAVSVPLDAMSDTSLPRGAALFATHCAACHGEDGTGGGSGDATAAGQGTTRPPDLTRIAARRDGVWPILEIMSIMDGYTQRTEPRQDMPIIADLTDGPMIEFDTGNGLVTPVAENLLALAAYLESLQSPPPERYVP